MALVGTGRNSALEIPESDDHYADFESAAKSNRPNMALYHLLAIVGDLRARIEELENSGSKSTAKKSTAAKSSTASSRKTTKGSSDSSDDE